MMDLKLVPTGELEAILKADSQSPTDREPDMELLMPVMEELARRYRECNPDAKTAAQALQEFQDYYLND